MTVPKLPLIVPKRALAGSSTVVPKLAPKVAVPLLPKGPPLAKSLHTGTNPPPSKAEHENSEAREPQKLTRLVSNDDAAPKKRASFQESQDGGDSVKLAPSPLPPKGAMLKNMTASSNTSFQDDLASRLNTSSILSDLSMGRYKSLSKSFSRDHEALSSAPKFSAAASMESSPPKSEPNAPSEKSHEHAVDEPQADERDDVGYTPWLKIEKRINQIRAMASKEAHQKPAGKPKPKPGLYNNYKTEYEEFGWKKELTHPLSYGIVQKLSDKRQFELPKDNWKFINGFIKPRRKPFTSMSEMSKYFQKVDTKDQYDLIKLLLACRDLEKVIEEQHTVLDMLDHDLREARDLFPDSLNNVTTKKLYGSAPEDEPFYPSSEVPLFIKGRVFLLPKNGKNGKK